MWGYIDMISIHWYYGGSTGMGSMTTNLNQVRDLLNLNIQIENTRCV